MIQRQARAALAGSVLAAGVSSAQAPCAGLVGDCDQNGAVSVGELVLAVNIALGRVDLASCRAADSQGDGQVSVAELIAAVGDALHGCNCPDCDDGNPCTRDVCLDDRCAHGPITCADDGNDCTAERCEPETGCASHPEDGISCDGGNGECHLGDCIPLPPTPTPTPGVDLVPASAGSLVPPSGLACLSSDDELPDPVNRFCVDNRGAASSGGFDILIAGERGSYRVRAEYLRGGSRACFSVPSVGGLLEVTADAAGEVDEIDEHNNTARFEAPTPIVTRPPACTPTVVP